MGYPHGLLPVRPFRRNRRPPGRDQAGSGLPPGRLPALLVFNLLGPGLSADELLRAGWPKMVTDAKSENALAKGAIQLHGLTAPGDAPGQLQRYVLRILC